ncbi:hypothetical protein TTRE_0000062801 [Trichuris trichiura]|uniref:Ionotropic glutamate receptor L-glutamate and glycine-binding domain-containing protein n=1 Tax=Trichuris trichiura TaxID=36087 RepID=A0A077YX72_TRITR|nr:hypothetical protein TTRE_0000062801 [Trichuris trichiura]
MDNNTLRIGVAPWFMMHPECFLVPDCYSGYELEVLELVAQMLHLSVVLVIANTTGCGSPINVTGNWSALCGMLQRNEIDITGNVCGLEQNRVEDFGFSWPVWQDEQTFWIRAPTFQSQMFNPAAPFNMQSWVTLAIIITCSVAVLSTYYYARSEENGVKSLYQASSEMTNSCFLFDRPPRKFFWICGLFFLAAIKVAYVTYIRAALLYPRPFYAPFRDINELAVQLAAGEYKLLHYHADRSRIVPSAPQKTEEMIMNAIEKHGYYYVNRSDYNVLLDGILEYPNAVMVKSSTFADVYAMLYSNRTKLWRIADEAVSSSPLSYLWRKGFPLEEKFNQALIELGNGKEEILRRKVAYSTHQVHNNPMLLGSTYSETDPIKLRHVSGPLVYLLICVLIASAVLFVERFWARR